MKEIIYYSHFSYRDWSFYLACSSHGLCYVGSSPASKKEMTDWVASHFPEAQLIESSDALAPYQIAFTAYLSKEKQTFDIETYMTGTPFQKKVWNSLRAIPYGETLTYGELATLIGHSPKAARAVGTALAANPLLIVFPCHRVVPKSSKPKAFRGGLMMKEKLLSLESDTQ